MACTNNKSETTLAGESGSLLSNKNLESQKRVITTHDAQGRSIFDKSLPERVSATILPSGTTFGLCYATSASPIQMNDDMDIQEFSRILSTDGLGLMIHGGTVLRHVDIQPGRLSSMHRTMSLDYGVVLQGEVELLLDSGEVRLLAAGDVAVQRGTMHAWRNPSDTIVARMLFVLISAFPLKIDGKVLDEDPGDLPVKASSDV
ncbi:hypothetical protein AOQ84DRAFT_405247 [Glonium stellatum]|uniref:Cupin type-2 domain-containing protein n=1 Tax=Glonium stellatum TaxID=574774 RepID=A0A8E2JTJ5_9PEZI|nr:hypothetical protein AOQ84DRAFT_405247 [Glonium stellatum]